MFSIIIQLILNRIFIFYHLYKRIDEDEMIMKPNLLQWFSLCVWLPMQEEILFRYAGYHLLERYIENVWYLQLVNGILFGLLHASNGLVVKMRPLDYLMIIIANGHLGYLLATLHDNIFLCIVIHGIYNFVGISSILYLKKSRIETDEIQYAYVYTTSRRRANSLGFVNKYDNIHKVDKAGISKELSEMFDRYTEKNNIVCKKLRLPYTTKIKIE